MELHVVHNSLACIWKSIPQIQNWAYNWDVGQKTTVSSLSIWELPYAVSNLLQDPQLLMWHSKHIGLIDGSSFPLHLFLEAGFHACPCPVFWILPSQTSKTFSYSYLRRARAEYFDTFKTLKLRPSGWPLYEESESGCNKKIYHCNGMNPLKSNHTLSMATRDSSRKACFSTIFTILSRE